MQHDTEERPGETLSTETVFRGRVFSVSVDRARLPTGREVRADVIRHGPSVVIAPMVSATRVILIRQYRYVVDRWLWELPAGGVDPGETPAQAAARECREEIGLTPGRLEPLGTYYPTPGTCDEIMHFFVASDLTRPAIEDHAAMNEDEVIRPQEVDLAEAHAMVSRGEIIDMKTALALARLTRGLDR